MTRVSLKAIERDVSIQCRASIDIAVVAEYAERMVEGDRFPPVILYGTHQQCWIGDGWHRVMASDQVSFKDIDAELRPGGRVEALKHALAANAQNGLRRTNADKRRCVEIALKEFPKLSDAAIGELCGVDHKTVAAHRPAVNLGNSQVEKRVGRDGKARPAQPTTERKRSNARRHQQEEERPRSGPPCVGMQFARIAVMKLEEIREDDQERAEAFAHVKGWLARHGA